MARNPISPRPPEPGETHAGEPLALRRHPDPVLRTPCEPVDCFDSWLAGLCEEMLALMRLHQGIGLAGPQVGLLKRVLVAEVQGRTLCLANPVIRTHAGRTRMVEGCLSLPGIHAELDRALHVEVRGYDPHGKVQEFAVQGLWARVMQHEIDHLDGVLLLDRVLPGVRRRSEASEP